MGAIEDLAAALAGQQIQQQLAQHNPYADFANLAGSMGNTAVQLGSQNPKRYGTGEVIGTALASGVLQGLLGNLGDSYQADMTDKFQTGFKNMLLGQPVDSAGLPASIFKTGESAANIFKLQKQLATADLQVKNDLETKKSLTQALAKAGTAREREQILKVGQEMGIFDKDISFGGAKTSPIGTDAQPDMANLPLDQKIAVMANQFIEQYGAPAGVAFETAAQALKPDRNEMEAAQKKVEELRTASDALEQVANTAEAGVAGAGETGGTFGGLRNWASKLLASVGVEDQVNKQASQALIESTAPDIIKASRTAGAGAMSDAEMRSYLGAGPTSDKTPAQNRLLIEKAQNVAKINREYADFLDFYRTRKGTLTGADEIWRTYKAAFPIFDMKGQFNADRPSWRDFIQMAAKGEAPQLGSQSRIAEGPILAAPSGAPSVGGTFQGQKVISVKKIG